MAKKGLRFNKNKPKLSLIPKIAQELEARAWEQGEIKYGKFNWQLGMEWSKPLDCLLRHALAIADGEWIDKETGVPHLALIRCNSSMLLEYYYKDIGKNDLPLKTDIKRELDGGISETEDLNIKYKDDRSNDDYPIMETKDLIKGLEDELEEDQLDFIEFEFYNKDTKEIE